MQKIFLTEMGIIVCPKIRWKHEVKLLCFFKWTHLICNLQNTEKNFFLKK